jgi:hypothetical protein
MNGKDIATRRRFVLGAGAVLAAPVMLAGATGAESQEQRDARLAALEDANALRELQRAYAHHVNARNYGAAAELFARPALATFDDTIRELSAESSTEEAPIEIAADRRTAAARAACVVRIETPIDAPGCTLVDMARAQGEGLVRSTERRVLEHAFVRVDGVWKIESATHREPG